MRNPFEVLGISEGSTDDQIKEAYRNLARGYQAESHIGGSLPETARERMRELDEAYDSIMFIRRGDGGNNSTSQSKYPDIRLKISENRTDDAETLLDGVLPDARDAEWHFLKATIMDRRGWFDEAERHFAKACEMEPGNNEFAAAYNNILRNRSGGYRTPFGGSVKNMDSCSFSIGKNGKKCGPCEICSGLMCLDCICRGMRCC